MKNTKTKHADGLTIYRSKTGWRWRHYRKGKITHASTEGFSSLLKCKKNLISADYLPISMDFIDAWSTPKQRAELIRYSDAAPLAIQLPARAKGRT